MPNWGGDGRYGMLLTALVDVETGLEIPGSRKGRSLVNPLAASTFTGDDDDEPAPVMLTVAGKRYACERCGATVFSHAGENFACNGCGTLYGGKERATDG